MRTIAAAGRSAHLPRLRSLGWRVACPRCCGVQVMRLDGLAKNPRFTQRVAGGSAARWPPRAAGDRRGRDGLPEGTPLSPRRQRPRPADLGRRQGPHRGELRLLLCRTGREEDGAHPTRRDRQVESVSHLAERADALPSPATTGFRSSPGFISQETIVKPTGFRLRAASSTTMNLYGGVSNSSPERSRHMLAESSWV